MTALQGLRGRRRRRPGRPRVDLRQVAARPRRRRARSRSTPSGGPSSRPRARRPPAGAGRHAGARPSTPRCRRKAERGAAVRHLPGAQRRPVLRPNGGAAVVLDAKTGERRRHGELPDLRPERVGRRHQRRRTPRSCSTEPHSANNPLLNRADPGARRRSARRSRSSTPSPAWKRASSAPYTTFFCPGYFNRRSDSDDRRSTAGPRTGTAPSTSSAPSPQSCDVYFYNVGYHFYRRKGTELEDWAKRLGMGKPTGIDIPGEVRRPGADARVEARATSRPRSTSSGSRATRSTSPSVRATSRRRRCSWPSTYAAIANGGYVVTPHLGLKVVDAAGQDGARPWTPQTPKQGRHLASTLDVVRRGLVRAPPPPDRHVRRRCSAATRWRWPARPARPRSSAQGDYAWYASYAPADDPKYVVVVMIEKGGHGGTAAAPAARMIYDALFDVDSGQFSGAVEERLTVDLARLPPAPRLHPAGLATAGLIGYGVTMVYFATRNDIDGAPAYYVRQQLVVAGVGLVAAVVAVALDYELYRRWQWLLYALRRRLDRRRAAARRDVTRGRGAGSTSASCASSRRSSRVCILIAEPRRRSSSTAWSCWARSASPLIALVYVACRAGLPRLSAAGLRLGMVVWCWRSPCCSSSARRGRTSPSSAAAALAAFVVSCSRCCPGRHPPHQVVPDGPPPRVPQPRSRPHGQPATTSSSR